VGLYVEEGVDEVVWKWDRLTVDSFWRSCLTQVPASVLLLYWAVEATHGTFRSHCMHVGWKHV
jgi:hypothetical protein